MSDESPGWGEYSRLVIQQLESLSTGIDGLRQELQEVKRELTELKAKEDRVQDIKIWKEKMDEVASPSQMKELVNQVEDLKLFKTKAVTIFMVVQFGMGMAMALMSYFG